MGIERIRASACTLDQHGYLTYAEVSNYLVYFFFFYLFFFLPPFSAGTEIKLSSREENNYHTSPNESGSRVGAEWAPAISLNRAVGLLQLGWT